MPFTEARDREKVDRIISLAKALDEMRLTLQPGDRCFNHYRNMKKDWKKERRWATADKIAAALYPDPEQRAFFLAFLVFFSREVMKYEEEKLAANGEVE